MKKSNYFESNVISVDVLFNGGLGNQIFQFIAGEYVKNSFGCDELKFSRCKMENIDVLKARNKQRGPVKSFFQKEIQSLTIEKLIDMPEIKKIDNKFKSINSERVIQKFSNKINYYCRLIELLIQYKFSISNFSRRIYLAEDIPFKLNLMTLEDGIFNCIKIIQNSGKRNLVIKLDGFWQDPSPYLDNLDKISLDFKKKIFKFNQESLLKPGSYIAIHARRGDYINQSDNAKTYYSNFSLINFLMSSINLLPSEFDNYPLVLVSDDLDWFREINLNGLSMINRKFTLIEGNEIDHWNILNNAKLNIISNSTFSYTAALLNNSNLDSKLRVIMPFWFNNYTTTFDKGWQKIKGAIAV